MKLIRIKDKKLKTITINDKLEELRLEFPGISDEKS